MSAYQSKHTGAAIDAGIDAANAALPRSGGSMTGPLVLSGEPTTDNGAATKKYVDDSSPTATVTKVGPVATITITDKNGTTTATVSDGAGGSGDGGSVDVEGIIAAAKLAAHPVGSIYQNATDPTSPETLFGGTWEPIEGVFLLASGTDYPVDGLAHGEAEHTLTIDEMPTHSHDLITVSSVVEKGSSYSRFSSSGTASADIIGETGGGQAHNNMPPYRAVYTWIRTA